MLSKKRNLEIVSHFFIALKNIYYCYNLGKCTLAQKQFVCLRWVLNHGIADVFRLMLRVFASSEWR
jgi:hypothetical protein